MSEAFTAKVWQINNAPARIELLGDKTKKSEPAQHIIEFPGGAIELSRISDGLYWAHIIVNRGYMLNGAKGLRSRIGKVVDSRVDRDEGRIDAIEGQERLSQIAVLIGREEP